MHLPKIEQHTNTGERHEETRKKWLAVNIMAGCVVVSFATNAMMAAAIVMRPSPPAYVRVLDPTFGGYNEVRIDENSSFNATEIEFRFADLVTDMRELSPYDRESALEKRRDWTMIMTPEAQDAWASAFGLDVPAGTRIDPQSIRVTHSGRDQNVVSVSWAEDEEAPTGRTRRDIMVRIQYQRPTQNLPFQILNIFVDRKDEIRG